MKISGFTIIRNAVKFDYPIIESIRSILSICDEFIVLMGESEDDTHRLIRQIDSPKIKIIHSIWDESLRQGGKILTEETNKALSYISTDSDWAFYLQADEVVHENDLPLIKKAMSEWINHPEVEGLLFNFKHFYGSYNYIGDSRKWYRKEIRIIRVHPQIKSYRDAQGFRKNGKKLNVKAIEPTIYHYGWVKDPKVQINKLKNAQHYWKTDQWGLSHQIEDQYNYAQQAYLKKYTETHPLVMQNRIENQKFSFTYNSQKTKASLRFHLLYFIEKLIGWRVGEYKNYRII